MSQSLHAVEVTDVLTASEIVGTGYSNRVEYVSPITNARFVFAAKENENAIQLKYFDTSGLAVMESPGLVKSITVDMTSATIGLSVYGSNTPYDSYKKTLSNEDILIANGVTATETVPVASDCQYFYIRPAGGTVYINSITIVWEVGDIAQQSDAPEIISSNGASFYPSTNITFAAADGAAVYYSTGIELTADNYKMVGTLYDGVSLRLEKSATVYAIAIEDGKAPSEVSVLSVQQKAVTEFGNIAALLAAEPVPASEELVAIGNPVMVIGKYALADNSNTYYLYVEDSTGGMVICSRGNAFPDSYVPGVVIDDFVMNYIVHGGLPAGVATDYIDSFGDPLRIDAESAPAVVTTVDDAMKNHYVRLEGVKVADNMVQVGSGLPICSKFVDHVMSAWDADTYYNIDAMVGCENDELVLYYLTSEVVPTVVAPVIYLEEDDLELDTFDTYATFGMAVPDNDSAEIRFTTDGSDPRESESARLYSEPVRITATTTIKAYAVVAGMAASDVAERTFVKMGSDVVYILDFLNLDDKSASVKFVGDVIVTGHGTDYLFVEDEMGYHLAVLAPEGWGDKRYALGSRISGFSISYPVDQMENVNLAQADVSTFGEPVADDIVIAPTFDSNELLDESIVFGRVITLTGATLEVNELSRAANGWSIHGVVPVDFSQFGDVPGWPSVAEEGTTYAITGTVMPDDTGIPVVWPMAIVGEGDRLSIPNINGRTQFENSTMVSITAATGADIYYTIDGSEPAFIAGGSTLLYVGPFEITATTTVKAVAVIDGREPSHVAVAHFVETFTTGVDGVDSDGSDAIYGIVGGIVAPAGAEIYDYTGHRIAVDRICAGIYVVRFAGRSVKVIVR